MLLHKWNYFFLHFNHYKTIIFNTKSFYLIYLYTETYYFFYIDRRYNNLLFSHNNSILSYTNFQQINLFIHFFNKIFRSTLILNYKFIYFKGRGYRYRYNKNILLLVAGLSHFIYFKIYDYFLLDKTRITILFLNYFYQRNILKYFIQFRFLNIFTIRGLGFFKGFYFKKIGKISTYF